MTENFLSTLVPRLRLGILIQEALPLGFGSGGRASHRHSLAEPRNDKKAQDALTQELMQALGEH